MDIESAAIREIAFAICKSRSCEGAACCRWPGNGGRVSKDCPVEHGGYDDAARAAFDRVREMFD